MPAPPRIAAIVVTYNGRPLLERFLPSLLAAARQSRHVVRVYVADNASTDGTREWLAQQAGVVPVVNARNLMWAGGNNAGARQALTDGFAPDWLVFLNNDIEVADGFFDALLDVPDDPSIALIGPKTLFLHQAMPVSVRFGTDRTLSARAGSLLMELEGLPDECRARVRPSLPRGGLDRWVLTEPVDLLVPMAGPGRLTVVLRHHKDHDARLFTRVTTRTQDLLRPVGFGGSVRVELDVAVRDLVDVVNNAGTWIDPTQGECGDIGFAQVDRGQYDRPRPVDAICGVALAVRATVFRRLGGFDEGYALYFEDTDFSARAAEQGLRAWFNPRATIRHLHSATAREHSPFWASHVAASHTRFRQRFQDPRRFDAWAGQQPDGAARQMRSLRREAVAVHLFQGRLLCR